MLRIALLVLLSAVAVVASWAAAVAAFLAAGAVSDSLIVLFLLAALAALVIGGTGSWLAARMTRRVRPGRYGRVIGILAVVGLAVLASATVLRPLPGTPSQRSAPAGIGYWQLSTGSRLAYVKTPAVGTPRDAPIVVVGGGPGEAVVANRSQARYFSRFAGLGHDVYRYDQLGAGLSSRLTDPAGYTVRRHVADLEAIRERIGAARMILMGSSWGGSLVASYLTRYPEHVERAVFTSPAPIDYARWPTAGDPASHLPAAQRDAARALLPGNLRFLLWYVLGAINPQAAHSFVSDREADAFFDAYLDVIRPVTVCDAAHLPDADAPGNGFYDNVFTTRSATAGRQQAGVVSALAKVQTPALVLTGGCNYIDWRPTREYATVLPNATLVCLPDAGHVIYLDEPQAYERTIAAFLRGEALQSWPTDRPCSREPR